MIGSGPQPAARSLTHPFAGSGNIKQTTAENKRKQKQKRQKNWGESYHVGEKRNRRRLRKAKP
jgi:hypothetical protein